MKLIVAFFILIVVNADVRSQHIAAKKSTAGGKIQKPLKVFVIIKTKNDSFLADTAVYSDDLIKHINPNWIDSVWIVRRAKASKNTSTNLGGEMIIRLNDTRYPNAFKIIDMYIRSKK
jgi:hypothetical protein